jgi:hypothetical protein
VIASNRIVVTGSASSFTGYVNARMNFVVNIGAANIARIV